APLLRTATAGDADQLARLFAVLGYPCTPAEARTRVGVVADEPQQRLLVAEREGMLLGMLALDFMYYLPLGAISCRVVALAIAPEAQRQGIGRWLLREAEQQARQAGAARIELTSAVHRAEAHEFYRQCGYEDTAVRFMKRLGDA
ncbi:MAG: GNAT family N-acetyltransferase, partial [Arenimonas sp.]